MDVDTGNDTERCLKGFRGVIFELVFFNFLEEFGFGFLAILFAWGFFQQWYFNLV